jgi:hypothetical protein
VAFDTTSPLPKTKFGNRYVLVAIDHYSKCYEVKAISYHDTKIVAKFQEDEIIYKFGIPKYIFIDNGSEWSVNFD